MHEPIDSPEALLAGLFSTGFAKPATVFLSGDFGAGKTLFCLKLARLARQNGIEPDGLISPGAYEDGKKIGIDLLAVHNGERRRMALRRPEEPAPGSPPLESLHWIFDQTVLEWGNRVLGDLAGGDLLIIDELGPLELMHGIGWTAGLSLLDSQVYRLNLVVVRPALLDRARQRWTWGQVVAAPPTAYNPTESLV